MQDDSGSFPEVLRENSSRKEDSQSPQNKVRCLTRVLVGSCVFIWVASSFAFLGAEWLHTRQQPQYVKVVSRPPHMITTVLRTSGCLAIITGIGGWWAGLYHRHGYLFTFSYITFFTSVLEISCGSVTLSYAGKTNLLMSEDVVRDLKRITDPMANETTNKFLALQTRLFCCGVKSYRDWIDSPWWHSQRDIQTDLVVPKSCCTTLTDQDCNKGPPPYRIPSFPNLIHQEGCMKRVSAYMNFLFYMTGCLAFVGGLLKFVGFFVLHYLINVILMYQQIVESETPE